MTSEIKPKPFNSIGTNLAAGAASFGVGCAGWFGAKSMSVFGGSGEGVSRTLGVAGMVAGVKILYDGVCKPLYGKALNEAHKVQKFMDSYSMRNGAVFLGAIPATVGAAGTLVCLAAGAPAVALGSLAVGAGGAAYLYRNRNNLFDEKSLSDSPLEMHEIRPDSRLHLDYPTAVKLKEDDIYYSSFGAAYEARKFLPAYREEHFQLFMGQSAAEIRELVSLAQTSDEKARILNPQWLDTDKVVPKSVNDALESAMHSKFGLGVGQSDLTRLQREARSELLKTKEQVLHHPDITNAAGDKVYLPGRFISPILMQARETVRKENEDHEREVESRQAKKSSLKSSSSSSSSSRSRPSLFSSSSKHGHRRSTLL